ncbi:hypothetical protein E2P42_01950 [Candidatus Bathyarchaeota archaeon]|nr:hypothetical protein E2P42_01950 [Candidatus Bathyarchaeota archaeon]
MHKKIKISTAVIAVCLLGILATNLAMAATFLGVDTTTKMSIAASNLATPSTSNAAPSISNVATALTPSQNTEITISAEQAEDESQLKALVPATPEQAEASIVPVRTRYLLWTHDGVHVMWGVFGNGRFVGTDNLGKRCWGIYGYGIFAGFYDGEFFWGKYENGAWKAQYLFGLKSSYGKFITFPQPTTTANADIANLP